VNLVKRLLDRFGSLPTPETVKAAARNEPGLHLPTTQMRAFRELEPPSADEGFAGVEHVAFTRIPRTGAMATGVLVAAAALRQSGWEDAIEEGDVSAPHLVFDWIPHGTVDELAKGAARLGTKVVGPIEMAVCPHGGGPPACWCRPPLPGLPLAFARAHGVDLARSILVGTSPAHRTLATTLGARYREG
jgi:hypothetical protein